MTKLKPIRTTVPPGAGALPLAKTPTYFFGGGNLPGHKTKTYVSGEGSPPGGLPGEYQNQWPMVDNALQLTNFNLNHVPVNPRHEIETRANQWPMVDNMLQLPNNLNHERVNPTYKNHMARNGSMHEPMTSVFFAGARHVLGPCFFLFCGVLNATGDSFDGTYYQNI